MSWLAPTRSLAEQPVRAQLVTRYAAVRLWAACAALPLCLVASFVSGRAVGFECAIVISALLVHALFYLRRATAVEWALVVDTTVVGLIALILQLPVAAGMGSAFLALTVSILAQGRRRRWLLVYVAAWLLGALAAALAGAGPGYSETMLHLLTTITIAFFLTSIAATVVVVMAELDRRDQARREATQLLCDSEERFRTLVQEAFEAVAVMDAQGRVQYASESYERVTGFSRSDRPEAILRERIHPDDVATGRETIDRAWQHPGETVRCRLRARRDDGRWRSLDLAVSNLLHNPAIAGVVCNLRDITEQERAEDGLRASERRFRGAFENAPIGMALLSLHGDFLQVNPALAALLGYAPESLTAMNWREVDACDPSGPDEEIAALLSERAPFRQMERRQLRADGSARECTVSLSVVADARQRPHHLIMQMADVTALKEAQRNLEQALRAKDEFVASVSHELRTPLTAVIGFGSLLRAQPSPLSAKERQETIEVLTAQAGEVARIVEDLLVVARSDASNLQVARVVVDLRAEVTRVLEGWVNADVARVVVESGTEYACADASRVRQILRNLILNALRYGGEHIRVAAHRARYGVSVVVADDGPGIPDEARERVFEAYQQAHRAPGLTASIGIGLTVSRRLARLMGGDLTYRYENGEAVFELALPAVASSEESAVPRRSIARCLWAASAPRS
ncbi:MAG: PAS domain S-box protein [Acidimicrobiia bacterium]|nr:PAS domain S-box protein [Acidimicrobiia bacterium]